MEVRLFRSSREKVKLVARVLGFGGDLPCLNRRPELNINGSSNKRFRCHIHKPLQFLVYYRGLSIP